MKATVVVLLASLLAAEAKQRFPAKVISDMSNMVKHSVIPLASWDITLIQSKKGKKLISYSCNFLITPSLSSEYDFELLH